MKQNNLNTTLLLQIALIITLLFCMSNWNKHESFNVQQNKQSYAEYNGHCISNINNDKNSNDFNYPNYYLSLKKNRKECADECAKIDSCQGYNYDNLTKEDNCRLYSFAGDKKGTNNTLLINDGIIDDDNKFKDMTCHIKNDFTKQGKTMTQYTFDILNTRENNIKKLYEDMNESYVKNIPNRENNKKMIKDYIDTMTDKLIYHTLNDVNETNYDIVKL